MPRIQNRKEINNRMHRFFNENEKIKSKTYTEVKMNMQEMIFKLDPANQFKVLTDSYQQVEYAWNNDFAVSSINTAKIKNIILTGRGSQLAESLYKLS